MEDPQRAQTRLPGGNGIGSQRLSISRLAKRFVRELLFNSIENARTLIARQRFELPQNGSRDLDGKRHRRSVPRAALPG
jgi:hypothetical protein